MKNNYYPSKLLRFLPLVVMTLRSEGFGEEGLGGEAPIKPLHKVVTECQSVRSEESPGWLSDTSGSY